MKSLLFTIIISLTLYPFAAISACKCFDNSKPCHEQQNDKKESKNCCELSGCNDCKLKNMVFSLLNESKINFQEEFQIANIQVKGLKVKVNLPPPKQISLI